jgi:hypothetical protein
MLGMVIEPPENDEQRFSFRTGLADSVILSVERTSGPEQAGSSRKRLVKDWRALHKPKARLQYSLKAGLGRLT